MLKRIFLAGFILSCIVSGIPSLGEAFTILTKDQALKEVFFQGAEIEMETKKLSGEALEKVKKTLGGSLVLHQEGSESESVRRSERITFYFAKKNGERKSLAIIDVQPGKWGPIEFIIAMDINGTITAVRVMSYQEIRGRPIARLSYMDQYKDKNVNSTLTVGKDIVGISGATISSQAATFTVKKALVLYNELYGKKSNG